ncbi:MAG TPA: hypothetical protein ENK57_25140 [Polyangiaceae bacterium]|nr:hypothetical protein [Polyangiaceae bacterium]
MSAAAKITLTTTDRDQLFAWRDAFEDRPEVSCALTPIAESGCDAWAVATKRGDLDPVVAEALGPELVPRLREQIRSAFGGSLPADFALCLETGGETPSHVIAVSNTPRNPEGVDDHMRVTLATGAALQAVVSENQKNPGAITSLALPALGPAAIPAAQRAELMWTAYDLFCKAEFPDFPTMRQAISGLLVGLRPQWIPGSYKRRFATLDRSRSAARETMRDGTAWRAQLERQRVKQDK